jgi:hypothetical protein
MRISLSAALLASAIVFGAAGAAMAQAEATAAAPDAGALAEPVKSGPPSIDWPIQDLLADRDAKGVIEKNLPGVQDDPRLDAVKTMSMRRVATFPEAQIDQAKLDAIQAELAALSKPPS